VITVVSVVDIGGDDDLALARFAYELSSRSLAEQESVLNELRARTGTLLAASSLVTSFLGGRALDGGTSWIAAPALVVFVGSILASVYVLLPKSELVFAFRGSVVFEELVGTGNATFEAYRRVAYWLESFREDNRRTLDGMHRAFWCATAAVTIEVILWVVDLGIS
jgi:hypothetical protein